ncbi:MAG TPA: TRAP transporter permease [bacterium]
MEKLEVSSDQLGSTQELRLRPLQGGFFYLIRLVGIAMAIYHIVILGFYPTDPQKFYAMHLLFATVLAFLLVPGRRRGATARPTWWDWLLIVITTAVVVYQFVDFEGLTRRAGVVPTTLDLVFGLLLILVVIESVRRISGWALPIMVGLVMLYPFVREYLPGLLHGNNYEFSRVISFQFGENGIYSTPIATSARYVYLFVLLGAFLEGSGIGRFIVNLGLSVAGRRRGGPAKVSIVTSALFGTASGSSAANVMVDGVINIPLMKSVGFSAPVAGAIEATTSTGGQIVPPVMGAAAFLMADILGIPYGKVAVAAIGPALLYYVSAFWMIDLYSARAGLRGLPKEQLPRLGATLLRSGYLLAPLVVLLYLIMIVDLSPFRAALWALVVTVGVSLLRAETRLGLLKILDAMYEGSIRSIEIATTTAAAGMIVGILSLTGLGGKIALALVALTQGNLVALLFASMIVALVLGTGLPTTADYAIIASTLAPAIIQLGVAPLSAHMFLFYFACLSAITPPVALAVYAAASLARASMWETGFHAMKFAAAGFLVPYMFVFGPQLLLQGSAPEVGLSLLTATLGTLCLAAAVVGYLLKPATWPERAVLFAASLLLIDPGLLTDVLGFALLAAAVLMQRLRRFAPAVEPA